MLCDTPTPKLTQRDNTNAHMLNVALTFGAIKATMSKADVPNAILDIFAKREAGRCQIAYDASSITLTGKSKQVILTRPCSMPEVEAAAKQVAG